MIIIYILYINTLFRYNITIYIWRGDIVMSDKHLHIRIEELLKEKGISKTRICKDLDLQRGNFNRYCHDDFHRIDANLIIKLCEYFQCEISDLLEIQDSQDMSITPVRRKSVI